MQEASYNFAAQEPSDEQYGLHQRYPVVTERRQTHDAELATRAASRDRRAQRANSRLQQPQADINHGVSMFTNIPQLPLAGRQQMDSQQWSGPNAASFAIPTQPATPVHSGEYGSFLSGPGSVGEEMDDFIADLEPWHGPSGVGLTDGEAAHGGEDPFAMFSLPPGNSPVTSQPIDVRRKAPLVRRTKPRQPMPQSPLTPIVNRQKALLVKRAGPPSASYPIAICKTPAPSQAMLSVDPGVDYSEPCLGADSQENVQSIDSATGFKRYFHEVDNTNDNEHVDDFMDENGSDDTPNSEFRTPSTKKHKRATQSTLHLHHRRIVEHAKAHLYAKLATQKAGPFPAGLAQDTVLTDAWLLGFSEVAGDLRLDPMMEPAEEDLVVLRQAASAWRGSVKSEASSKLGDTFGFKKGCGTKSSLEVVTENREIYQTMFSEFAAWTYLDPKNPQKGMFRGPIVFKIVFAAYFSKGEGSPAFKGDYFNPKNEGLPFEAIAFVLTAIHAAIEDYKLGYWSLSEFSARSYKEAYKQYLKMLLDWDVYTSKPTVDRNGMPKEPSRLAAKFRKELWEMAMGSSGVTVVVDDSTYMSSAKAEAAFAANED